MGGQVPIWNDSRYGTASLERINNTDEISAGEAREILERMANGKSTLDDQRKLRALRGVQTSSDTKRQNRIKVASQFLKVHLGKSSTAINQMLTTAIDLGRSVKVKNVNAGTHLYRWEREGQEADSERHFFVEGPYSTTEVGFESPRGYVLKKYEVLKSVDVLETSIKGRRGNGTQIIFDGNSDNIRQVPTSN